MADQKVINFTPANLPLTGTELVPVIQNGNDCIAPASALGGSSTVTVSSPDASLTIGGSPGNTLTAAISQVFNLTISTTFLPQATVGTAYSAALAVSGGSGTGTWALTSSFGATNVWALSPSGALTGTPTTNATDTLAISYTDAGTNRVAQRLFSCVTAGFNPMGIAFGAAGIPALDEVDFPVFQDQIRACRAFTKAASPSVQAALDGNGWPTEDVCIVLHEGGAVVQQWSTNGVALASPSQTVATPGVFTTASQSLTAGTPVILTGGAAPGGFSLNTQYYVIAAGLTATTCQLATTAGGTGIQCTSSAACTIYQAGKLACGFTGVGTIGVNNNCILSNIVVLGSGATQTTTFDCMLTGTTNALQITATTPGVGVQNVFAYLPAYRSSQFNVGNVNGYSATSLFTTESITFGKQFGWIRDMFYKNAWNDTAANTSVTRRTPANCKCNQFFNSNQTDGYPLDWLIDYLLAIKAAGGNTGLWHCFPPNCDSTYIAADIVSMQRLPAGMPIYVEWSNELWNGTGLAGAVVRAASTGTPADASFTGTIVGTTLTISGITGTPASGSSVLVVGAGVTANTNIVSGSGTTWTVSPSQNVGPVAMQQISYLSMYRYLGTLLHNLASQLRTAFGSRFGTDVTIVAASQQGSNGTSFLATMLNYMSAQGYTIPSDVHYLGVAPYINTTSATLSWTVSQIETNLTSGAGNSIANVVPNTRIETYSALAKYWGLKGVLAYEGGWQLNAENTGLINGGAAAIDSGMTAIESAIWSKSFDAGMLGITRHDGWCSSNGGNLGCIDDLGPNFQTLITTGYPRLAAMQTYMPGTYVRTRNLAVSGQTISGLNYTDNTGVTYPVFNNFGAAPPNFFGAGGLNGAYTFNIYAPAAASLALAIDFTNTSASAANFNVRLDGTQVVTGVGVVPGSGTNGGVNTVTLGTLVLSKGFHELTLGPFAALATLAITTSPPGQLRWT